MHTYSIAVIGHGYMAKRHIAAMAQQPRVALGLVVNRCQIVASHLDTPVPASFADDGALLSFIASRTDIDAVIVCSPDSTHVPYVVRLLEGRQTILCEKPLGRTAEEFDDIFAAVPRDTRRLLIGMNVRFRKRTQHLKALVDAGDLGPLHMVNTAYHSNIATVVAGAAKTWWKDYPGGITPFLHGGAIHMLDTLRYIAGDISDVMCVATPAAATHPLGGDTFAIVMKGEHGATFTMTVAGASLAPNRFQIHLEGTGGSVDDTAAHINDGAGGKRTVALPDEDFKDVDRQLAHLVDVLDGAATPLNSLDEAYRNYCVVRACERSLASGSWVRIGEHE